MELPMKLLVFLREFLQNRELRVLVDIYNNG